MSTMTSKFAAFHKANMDTDQKREAMKQIYQALTPYVKMEVTSLLEVVLWNMAIQSSSNGKGSLERPTCRCTCGANLVIPNVVSFAWDDSSKTGTNLFPVSLS